jgi:hypothetical protein
MPNRVIEVPFRFGRNGTLRQPDSKLRRGRVEDPALEVMGPAPERVVVMMGNQFIELIDPQEKSADRARVSLRVVLGDSADQAMAIASQGQERCPERRIFGVEWYFRDAPRPLRDGSPGRVRFKLGHRLRLTL